MDYSEVERWNALLKGSERKTIVMDGANRKIIDSENICGRPVLGKLIALPMRVLHKFEYKKPWAAISITDPDFVYPEISDENRVDLLRLQFDDIDIEKEYFSVISESQALEVCDFVEGIWDKVDLLMVHCHAGISRSTAICKAISERYQPDYAQYFDQLYSPNKLVHGMVSKIFTERDSR